MFKMLGNSRSRQRRSHRGVVRCRPRFGSLHPGFESLEDRIALTGAPMTTQS